MRIDWSKWFFKLQNGSSMPPDKRFSGLIEISNPSENISFMYDLYSDRSLSTNDDDPSRHLKEACKAQIRQYCIGKEADKLVGQQLPVEDNLDYIENEAQRRGLI